MTLQRYIERLIWLCLLPPVLLAVMLVVSQLHSLEQRRVAVAKALVASAARSVEQLLEVRMAGLQLLALRLQAQAVRADGSLNVDEVRQLADEFRSVHGTHVVIGAEPFRMLFNSRLAPDAPLPPWPAVVGRLALSVALDSQVPAVSDAFIGSVTGVPMIALAVPLLHRGAGPKLAVLTTLEAEQFAERLLEFGLPSNWRLALRDSASQRLAHAGPADDPSTAKPSTAALSSVSSRDFHTKRLSLAPWSVDLQAPPVSVLDDRWRQAALLMLTLLATVVVAYTAGRLASRRLKRAVASLADPQASTSEVADIVQLGEIRKRLRQLDLERREAEEAERRRIGLELHDDLQQRLALLRMEISQLQAQVDRSEAESKSVNLKPVLKQVDETLEATNRLVMDLRPRLLDDFGLPAALEALADQLQRLTQMKVDVAVQPPDDPAVLDPDVALRLYRLAQEALNNVRKHARARTVSITLDLKAPTEVVLEITDDGVGFDPRDEKLPYGEGLRGMRERAHALGGSLEVISHPGDGTALIARIPRQPSPPAPQA